MARKCERCLSPIPKEQERDGVNIHNSCRFYSRSSALGKIDLDLALADADTLDAIAAILKSRHLTVTGKVDAIRKKVRGTGR